MFIILTNQNIHTIRSHLSLYLLRPWGSQPSSDQSHHSYGMPWAWEPQCSPLQRDPQPHSCSNEEHEACDDEVLSLSSHQLQQVPWKERQAEDTKEGGQ
jgi:hypothetical protein